MLVIVLAVYVFWCGLLYFLQDRMMFPRDLLSEVTPDEIIPRHIERLWVTGADGSRVEGWFVPVRAEGQGGRAPCVILTHGNAELIDDCLGEAGRWNARGFHVLLCEYRGYGRSGGTPSEAKITADVVAFYDLVAARGDVDRARIIAHGRSLGAGVAAQLAGRRPVSALVLESGFRSATAFAARFGAPAFLVKSPFRTDRAIKEYAGPVLLMHSKGDEIIPFAHALALKKVRPDATLVELTGGHNSGLSERSEYWEAVDELVRRLKGSDAAGGG